MGEEKVVANASPYQTQVIISLRAIVGKLDTLIQKLTDLIECLCGQIPDGDSHVKAKCKCEKKDD